MNELRQGTRRRSRVLLLATGAATMIVIGCKDKDDAGDKAVPAVVSAQTVTIVPQAFTETFGAIGTVVGRSGHVATLSAPAAGRVSQILVTTGQMVQAGQALVEMDKGPFQAALQSAQAAYSAAERANERQQRLAGEGIVPKKDAESAAADMARAHSDVVAAERIEELSTLRAPIGGVVTRMAATLGASVDPAAPLVEISDPSALDVMLSVTPTDAARVHPGAKVALSAGQTVSGEPLGVGTVADVAGTVDSTTRSVAVRVQAPTTRRPLRIGETVYGAIAVATRPAAIVIPAEALVPEGDAFHVFVVDAKGIAHERDVTVGGRSAAGVEITEGLKAGERIVTTGAFGVQDSAKVTPLKPAIDSGKADSDAAKKPEKP
jgi:membrane fusion protein, multidrug efflux system